jgi:hypothetical protein
MIRDDDFEEMRNKLRPGPKPLIYTPPSLLANDVNKTIRKLKRKVTRLKYRNDNSY